MDYVTGAACLVPHAEVAIFSVSSCRTADTTTISAASPSLPTYFLRRGDQNWQHWKQMGTPMFHKASQSFYTQEQATSNPSCLVRSSPPMLSGPLFTCLAAKAYQAKYSEQVQDLSSKLQLPVLSSTTHKQSLDEPTHTPIHVSHTYFSKMQEVLYGGQCSSKKSQDRRL